MRIITGLRGIGKEVKGAALTLGIFDGVHIGHRKVLKRLVERAKRGGRKSIVLTFSPHPLSLISPEDAPSLLTSFEKRAELLGRIGADICVIVNFTRAFSKMRPEEFVRKILVRKFAIKELVVSADIRFGHRTEGDIEMLSGLSEREGFTLTTVAPVYRGGEIVSSTRIRRIIREGNISKAQELLGRPYSITGTVMRGQRRGALLGFPTANILPHHEVLPPPGVYCGFVLYNKERFKALANFGFRPTFYGKEKSFEINIFGFDKNIYHKRLEFIFMHYLRPEIVFPDKGSLIAQIKRDKEKALALLEE